MFFARAITVLGTLLSSGSAGAAEIKPSTNPACVLALSGEIMRGDYSKFLAAAAAAYPGADEVRVSSSADTICLDSPGGDLTEGVSFARHFYSRGVGTVIDDGAECYSACAIMFMMGTAQGSEVSFVNRRLHVRGTLGFHRPYLNITTSGDIDVRTLAIAYDQAYQSALDLISMGNEMSPWTAVPMMRSDLIQQMLSHVGDDMFLIDTVDRVSRFGIETFGYELPVGLDRESAFYACENALQWKVGLTTEDITYTAEVADMFGDPRVEVIDHSDEMPAFHVTGLASGYADESCVIFREKGVIKGCGVDEYTDTTLGLGTCDGSDFHEKAEVLPLLAVLNPATRLASLASKYSAAKGETEAEGMRCIVREGGIIVDSEICQSEALPSSDDEKAYRFVWPSGAKTVVVIGPDGFKLNGAPASAREPGEYGTCFTSSQTGRDFCVKPISRRAPAAAL
ncbi:hypothetical protein BSQ44_05805 [Aquibium oceanicum]|uniref:Lipoprotein n=2 Tax=Aquibium oceanicum TaxID=1670800 RepID=A0A1L3SNE7_9HYPH|nr:hypothetical protein BSQ44_05805 [Aquibium oceanicum]